MAVSAPSCHCPYQCPHHWSRHPVSAVLSDEPIPSHSAPFSRGPLRRGQPVTLSGTCSPRSPPGSIFSPTFLFTTGQGLSGHPYSPLTSSYHSSPFLSCLCLPGQIHCQNTGLSTSPFPHRLRKSCVCEQNPLVPPHPSLSQEAINLSLKEISQGAGCGGNPAEKSGTALL